MKGQFKRSLLLLLTFMLLLTMASCRNVTNKLAWWEKLDKIDQITLKTDAESTPTETPEESTAAPEESTPTPVETTTPGGNVTPEPEETTTTTGGNVTPEPEETTTTGGSVTPEPEETTTTTGGNVTPEPEETTTTGGNVTPEPEETTTTTGGTTPEPEETTTTPGGTTPEPEPEKETWELVTDGSTLQAGDKIVIVAKDYDVALGTNQKTNNRDTASVTKNGTTIILGEDVQILILEAGLSNGTFAFNTGSGYLYAASSSSNHLKTQNTLSDNGSWSITIAADGTATIIAQGTNTRNWLKYNSTNNPTLFSCYTSGQADVTIYKLVKGSEGGEPACEHTNTTIEGTVAATCTTAGHTGKTVCSDCGKTVNAGEVINALGHNKVNHDAKAPTCTAIGWDAYETCSRCDYTTYVEKAALGHDTEQHAAQAPTCTTIGWDAYETCKRTGCQYTTYVEKAALGHDTEQHAAQAPTCTAIGWDAYETCKRTGCQYTTYVEKAALNHKDENNDNRCDRDGCNSVLCGEGNHVEDAGTVTKAATCTDTGVKTFKCTACGDTLRTETLPALGHNYGNLNAKVDATCEQNGNIAYYQCSACQKLFDENKAPVENIVISAGHKYGNLNAKVDATCEQNGNIAYYQCSACQKYFDENKAPVENIVISAGHKYGNLNAKVDATCEQNGNIAYYQCSACQKYFDENKAPLTTVVIPSLGHTDDNGDYQCDNGCQTIMPPAADSTLTIEQANKLGVLYDSDTYSEHKYYVTGTITEVYGTDWGNMYITNGTTTFCIYGLFSEDGSVRYDAMATKPIAGDVITVYGAIGQHGDVAQIKHGWMTNFVDNTPEVEPDEPGTEGTKDTLSIKANEGSLAENKESISWTTEHFTVVVYKNASTDAIVTDHTDHFRSYKNTKITFNGKNGETIQKIVITCTESKYATSLCASAKVAGYEATANGTICTIIINNAGAEWVHSDGQVRLKNIEIFYTTSEGGDDVCEHELEETITQAATCTEAGSKTITCKNCDYEKVEPIAKLGHTTTNGVCGNCGQTIGGTTPAPEDPATSEWTKVDLADIKPTDIIVIVWTKGNESWAMSNDKGASAAPTAVVVTVSGNQLTGAIADNIKWNIFNDNGTLTIYPNGTTETWLYCTNTNNGVRVGTNAAKAFTIDAESGYLKHGETSRYVGVYTTNPDVRCYTTYSGTSNIVNQTIAFYKFTESTSGGEEETCTHANATLQNQKDATCTVDGYTGDLYCPDCETVIEAGETILAGHTYGNLIEAKDAVHTSTEMKAGVAAHYYCSACQTYFTEGKVATTLEALTGKTPEHTSVVDVAVGKTCTTDGKTEGSHCSVCNKVLVAQEIIPAAHTYGELISATKATCDQTGMAAHYYCTDCETYFDAQQNEVEVEDLIIAIDENAHNWGEWEQTKDPACLQKGEETRVCAHNSDHKETRPVDALEHDYKAVVTKPTCTEAGYTTYTCNKCGDEYTEAGEAKLDHDWGDWEQNDDGKTHSRVCANDNKHIETDDCSGGKATCTEQATCAVCGNKYGNALNHDIKQHAAQDPTCTEIGWDAYETCKREGCNYTTYVEKTALQHIMGAWIETTAPTCTVAGEETSECTRGNCNHKETRPVDALNHEDKNGDNICDRCPTPLCGENDHVTDEGTITTAATCTTEGVKTFKCTACGEILKTEPVPALGHDLEDVAGKDATCIEDGYTAYKDCKRCDHIEGKNVISATGHAKTNEYKVIDGTLYLVPTCGCESEKVEVDTNKAVDVATEADINTVLNAGYDVVLTTNITLSESSLKINAGQKVIINLAGYTLTADWGDETTIGDLLWAYGEGTEVTITGNGKMVCGAKGTNPCVVSATDGAKVTIENGEFISEGCACIYATRNGEVVINGGTFSADKLYYGVSYLLDVNEAETLGTITVYGGSFKGFNPANHTNDGPNNTNKLADGYHSIKNSEGYYVVNEHKHESEVTNPTCTAAGFTTYTCVCEDTYTVAGEAALNHIDENTDHKCDRNCGKTDMGTHADSATDEDHVCDYGCGANLESCADNNNDHNCNVCGAKLSNCSGGTATCQEKATCEICGEKYGDFADHNMSTTWTTENNEHFHKCTVDGCNYVEDKANCSGGTATCQEKATCEICGEKYGDFGGHTPAEAVKENETPATCTTNGSYDSVVYCSVQGCGAEISRTPKTIDVIDHTFVDNKCSVCNARKVTVTISIADYAAANGWVSGTKYATVKLNDYITVTANGGGNTGKYYSSNHSWRMYQSENAKIIFTTNDTIIVSVKITYKEDGGVLTFGDNQIDSEKVIAIAAENATFGVANEGGKIQITAIEVVYIMPPCEHTNTQDVERKEPTCMTPGHEAGKQCVDCGEFLEGGVEIPATQQHADTDGNYVCDTEGCTVIMAPAADSELSTDQAIALGKAHAQNTFTEGKYYVTGVITKIESNNLYIKDANGNGDFYVYKLNTEALAVGDTITLYGIIGYYNKAEMKEPTITQHTPATPNPDPEPEPEPEEPGTTEKEATITFDDDLTFTSNDSTRTWVENGITVTNVGSSNSYSNPARFYKNTTVTISYQGMTKIVITCNTNDYATACADSIGTNATANGQEVTITFADPVNSFEFTTSAGQVRVNSITVTYQSSSGSEGSEEEPEAPTCQHTETTETTTATCTAAGTTTVTCKDCGETVSTEQTAALGHNYVDGSCSKCGAEDPNSGNGNTSADPITASKTVAELITQYGWTTSTTKQTFNLDDKVTIKLNGGQYTGNAYDGNHIRIYATDSPAGTVTITVPEGYELVSIKITTKTGTYAYLYVDGSSTDICNKSTDVSGSSVKLNSVKNGSNGKQVRITAIEVVYKPIN